MKTPLLMVSATTVIATLAIAVVAGVSAESIPQKTPMTAAPVAVSAGLTVFLDSEGNPTTPTASQLADFAKNSAAVSVGSKPSADDLKVGTYDKDGNRIPVKINTLRYTVVTKSADGALTEHCLPNEEIASQFVESYTPEGDTK